MSTHQIKVKLNINSNDLKDILAHALLNLNDMFTNIMKYLHFDGCISFRYVMLILFFHFCRQSSTIATRRLSSNLVEGI